MPFSTLFLIALLAVAPAVHASPEAHDIDAAILGALERRLGPGAEVTLEAVRVVRPPEGPVIDAQIAPGARMGRPLQVRLGTAASGGRVSWTGTADVRARIVVSHAHAAHTLTRGTELMPEDVAAVQHEIGEGPLAKWPTAEELVNGTLVRNLAAGACIGRTSVVIPPAVRNGQIVIATARVDGVEATARLVAAGSGEPGAIIRVVNQDSRRVMRARIVAAGIVEIVP